MENGKFQCRWISSGFMKRLSAIIIAAILMGILTFICIHKQSDSRKASINIEILKSFVEDGDIIFRLGDRPWSLLIKDIATTKESYSHVGIIRKNTEITVINADTLRVDGKDGVIEVSINDFSSVAQRIAVFRVKSIEREKLSSIAEEYLGKPFDWEFDLSDESRIYCSELIYIVLKRIRPDIELKTIYIKELKKNVIPLDVCVENDEFEQVLLIESK